MKKTKILIPALGMMMLSTAAAVSGTMAWFSANRAVTVSTSNFAVESLDGSLVVTARGLYGTTINQSTGAVEILNGKSLLDASFDERSGQEHLYTDVVNDAGVLQSYRDLGTKDAHTNWQDATTQNYYGVTFQLDFEYKFSSDHRSLDLIFDTNSTCTVTNESNDYWHTYKGFRLAFIAPSQRFVWAPKRTAADKVSDAQNAADMTFERVTGATTADHKAYDAENYVGDITFGTSGAALAADDADHSSLATYLGTLTYDSSETPTTNKMTVICVAWYEGTDPAVINQSTMDAVSTILNFYVRRAQA